MAQVDRSHRSSRSSTAEDLEDYRTLDDDDEDLKPHSNSAHDGPEAGGKPVDMTAFFEPLLEANPPPRFEVRSMPWTDPDGHSGQFTGEVNSASVPDGKGFMRYDSLPMLEGKWEEGVYRNDPGYDDMPVTSEEMRGGRPRGAGNLKTIIERSFTSHGTDAYSHLEKEDSSTATPQRGGGGGPGRGRPFMQPVDASNRSNNRSESNGGWDDDSCVEDVTPRATLEENERARQQRRMREAIDRSNSRRGGGSRNGSSQADQNNVSSRSRSSSSGRGPGGRVVGMDNSDEVSGYSRLSGYSDKSVSRGVQSQSLDVLGHGDGHDEGEDLRPHANLGNSGHSFPSNLGSSNLGSSNREGNLGSSNREGNINSSNRDAVNISLNEDEGEDDDSEDLRPLRQSAMNNNEYSEPPRRSSLIVEDDDHSEDLKPLRRSEARSDAEMSASFRRSAVSRESGGDFSQNSGHSPLPPGKPLSPEWQEWNSVHNSKNVKSSFNSNLVQKPSHLAALLKDDDDRSKSEHSEHTASTAAQSNRRGGRNANGGGGGNINGSWRGPAAANPFSPNLPPRAQSMRNPGPAGRGGLPGGAAGGGGGFNWSMPPPPHSNADDPLPSTGIPNNMRPPVGGPGGGPGGPVRHGDSMVGAPMSRRQLEMLELRSSSNDDEQIDAAAFAAPNEGPGRSSLYADAGAGASERSMNIGSNGLSGSFNTGNQGGISRRPSSGGLLAMAHPQERGGVDDSESSGRNGYGFRASGTNHDGLMSPDMSPRGNDVPMYDDEVNSRGTYDSDDEEGMRERGDGVDESYRSSRSGNEEEGHSENEDGGRYSRMRRLNSADGIAGAALHLADGVRDRVDRHFEPMDKDQRKKRKMIYAAVFAVGLVLFIAVLASIPGGKKEDTNNSKVQQGGGSQGSSNNVPAVVPENTVKPTATPTGTPPPPCVDLTVEIRTDELGGQTTWELLLVEAAEVERERPHAEGFHTDRRLRLESSADPRRERAGSGKSESRARRNLVELVARGGPYPDLPPGSLSGAEEPSSGGPHGAVACLVPGRYEFILDDSGFDGMCCDRGRGGYTLTLGGGAADGVGRTVKVGSGFFTSQDRVGFEVTADDVAGVGSEGFPSALPSGAPSELPSISVSPSFPFSAKQLVSLSRGLSLIKISSPYRRRTYPAFGP